MDVHVISLKQAQCVRAQTGPPLQIILFGLLHEDYAACRLRLADARIVRSSASDPKTSEGYVAHYLLLAVTLPSTGPRESSSSDPKKSEGGNLLCSLPLVSMFLLPCLRAPSATGPKVVSPTVAPRSLGPNLERGVASTLWTRSASRSATLRAGRRDSSWQSTVRVSLQKLYCHRGRKKFKVKPLVRAKTISF